MLVVEDDRSVREVLGLVLGLEGYEVALAPDGLTALRLVEERRPDVVVLDALMPRLDGAGFAGELARRGLRPGIPIVLVTGDARPGRAGAIGPEATIAKPFDLEVLLASVAALAGGTA